MIRSMTEDLDKARSRLGTLLKIIRDAFSDFKDFDDLVDIVRYSYLLFSIHLRRHWGPTFKTIWKQRNFTDTQVDRLTGYTLAALGAMLLGIVAGITLLLIAAAILIWNTVLRPALRVLLWWNLDIRGKTLYFFTLLFELPGAVIRGAFFLFIFGLPAVTASSLINPGGVSNTLIIILVIVGIVTLWPILASLSTLVFPGGFLLTRFALGARITSRREWEMIRAALDPILAQAPQATIGPTGVFVIDAVTLEAYVVGTTLYLTRELIRNPDLGAVIAHELGHINSPDGRLVLALRRLVSPIVYYFAELIGQATPTAFKIGLAIETPVGYVAVILMLIFSFFVQLAGGGLGLLLLSPFWTWYWREREYKADLFASQCGVASSLAEFLEKNYQFADSSVPYFLSTHPYTELRIDKLLGYAEGEKIVEEVSQ
jgi:Zn-dependent protease with chaperone function